MNKPPRRCASALRGLAAILVAAMLTVSAIAEVPDEAAHTQIETIIVTATRIEQTPTETGSTVRIIDVDELDTMGFTHALDAVARAPGVTVNQNGSFGGAATVRIRGASSNQTLVLIDGVTVNDASSSGGGYNFARIDTENIERIEILSGPQSTLWGTDAIGGVVSITTKRPDTGMGGNLFAQAGSFDSFRAGASVSRSGDTGDFRLAATQLNTKGISRADARNGNREEDGMESLTLSARGGINLGHDLRFEGSLLWNDSDADFDSFRPDAEGSVGDGDELSKTEELSGQMAFKAPLFNARLDNLLLVGRAEIDRENQRDGETSFEAKGERTIFRYQGTLAVNAQSTLVVGAEREEAKTEDNNSAIRGLFALYEWRPMRALTLTGGVRSDNHNRFDSATSTRLAAAFQALPSLTLRGSWGEGFKAPTLFQTTYFCCGASAPNAALRPERSEGVDVGIEWRPASGAGHIGLTYFRQQTDNLIDFSFAVGAYENIDEVESKGFEVSAAWQFTDTLSLSADYAHIQAEEGDGTSLLRLPEHSGDIALGFTPSGSFSGAVLLRFNGREPDRGGVKLDDWVRIDISGRYMVAEGFELFGRIENLFDTHYQQILGYGTPGLSGSLGVRWRF